jgi:hypothetical protein
VLRCNTVSMYEQLDWLPNGVWLEREEVAEILVALRALIQGTDAIEPNRSHILSIVSAIGEAIDRAGGQS